MNLNCARRRLVCLSVVVGAAVGLAACGGGGGGGGGAAAPTVTAVTLSPATPKYRQPLEITVDGTALDASLGVTAQGCRNIVRSTTAPRASSATTAYYTCTVSAVGNGQVDVAASAGAVALQTAPFTVPAPQVTLTLSNGVGGTVNGDVVLTLDPAKAPITVDNFLDYVNDGFYAGTIFHRVLSGNLAEGGGYLPLNGGTTPVPKAARAPISLEVSGGLSNLQWTVAMARSAQADSATSRFFINLVDNPTNDPSPVFAGFAVFGNVTAGIPVVQALSAVSCAAAIASYSECPPNPDVRITAATQSR